MEGSPNFQMLKGLTEHPESCVRFRLTGQPNSVSDWNDTKMSTLQATAFSTSAQTWIFRSRLTALCSVMQGPSAHFRVLTCYVCFAGIDLDALNRDLANFVNAEMGPIFLATGPSAPPQTER